MKDKDLRFKKAEVSILEAFHTLINNHSIEDITVTDIISLAKINRSTFYAHYIDKYDLLACYEASVIKSIEELLHSSPVLSIIKDHKIDEDDMYNFFTVLVNYLEINQDRIRKIISRPGNSFITALNQMISEIWKQNHVNAQLTIPINYAASSFSWLLTGLICEWMSPKNCDNKEEFINILMQISKKAPKIFFS
jgi:AcrR family transcriptional regulator